MKLAETLAREKNNKPHEERGNQEHFILVVLLTVMFYHFVEHLGLSVCVANIYIVA